MTITNSTTIVTTTIVTTVSITITMRKHSVIIINNPID